VVGGLLVRDETLSAFRWLFAVNVVTYLVFLAVLPSMPAGKVAQQPSAHQRPGFRDVLGDRFFVWLCVTDVAVALGFGFLFSFMPAYASAIGIDKTTVGVLFMVGAVSVVVTQIATLRWARVVGHGCTCSPG
jgi:hypothetical protein